MKDSVQKACSFITALALSVIAVQLIPFSRDKELSNQCREYLAIINGPTSHKITGKINQKRITISNKAGISNEYKEITKYCDSFYLNQR